ncbi:MAG: outer membrane receptor for ferrienterochelin and colicins [Flavobacteriales bacterium]
MTKAIDLWRKPTPCFLDISRICTVVKIYSVLHCGLLAPYAFAQNNLLNLSLEELLNVQVVTAASGYEQNRRDAPAKVTIIEREQWQSFGATTFEDVVTTVSGVHTGIESLAAATPVTRIRGLSGDFGHSVKVLIDGIPIQDMSFGGRAFYTTPLIQNLKRIEVVSGPGSVVHGSDAFAGVINLVVPKAGDDSNNRIDVHIGEGDHRDLSFAHGGKGALLNWYIAAEHSEAGTQSGSIVEYDLQTTFDQHFNTNASQAPGRLSDEHQVSNIHIKLEHKNLSFNHFYLYGSGNARTGATNALDPTGTITSQSHSSRLRYKVNYPNMGVLTYSATYTDQYSINEWVLFPAGSSFPVGDDGNLFTSGGGQVDFPNGVRGSPSANGSRYDIRVNHNVELEQHHTIRWELGHNQFNFQPGEIKNFGPGVLDNLVFPENGSPVIAQNMADISNTEYAYQPDSERQFSWASLQDQWRVHPRLSISTGLRWDNYSDFGKTTNLRVALQWQANDTLDLHAYYGSAFRAPNLTELNSRNNPSSSGNPNVQPEKIDALEFSAGLALNKNLRIESSIYYYKTQALIRPIAIEGGSIRTFQNTAGNQGRGLEMELSWKYHDTVTGQLSYAFNSTHNSAGKTLEGVPKQLAYINVDWRLTPELNWNVGLKFVGERPRLESDERAKLKNYNLLNSHLRWTITPALSANWTISNLGDSDAREYMPPESGLINDLPLNSRLHRAGIEYRF